MIPYQKQKIDNAICFFASEYKYKTDKYLYSTYLYKLLAFLDFESIKENGRPALGLTYLAMERGPVPIEIYNERKNLKTECYEFKPTDKEYKKFLVVPKGEPNTDYFSDYEIEEMYRLIEIYADRYVKTNEISEASHESILAWKRAFKRKPNSVIDYKEEFPGDILKRQKDKIKFPEEALLNYLALTKINK